MDVKLIDILVRELPDLGGWPPRTESLYQNAKGRLVGTQGCIVNTVDMKLSVVAEDTHRSVTRQQYEAALAASKPEWGGEGLPPVGMEIEYKFTKVNYRTDFSRGKVLAYGMHNAFMEHWSSKNEFIQPLDKIEFRPIRSEADRKRDEALLAIAELCRSSASNGHSAELIYDAIKSGKIAID